MENLENDENEDEEGQEVSDDEGEDDGASKSDSDDEDDSDGNPVGGATTANKSETTEKCVQGYGESSEQRKDNEEPRGSGDGLEESDFAGLDDIVAKFSLISETNENK